MHYKEILKLEDIHEKEVNFYSTVDIDLKSIIGISIKEPNIYQGEHICGSHFSIEDTKAIIKALSERLEELEKPDNKNDDDDEAIDLEKKYNELSIRVSRSFDIIVSLEKRIESLELALRSLSSHLDDKNKDREYIEKMKAVSKGYEDMYHKYFNLLYGQK